MIIRDYREPLLLEVLRVIRSFKKQNETSEFPQFNFKSYWNKIYKETGLITEYMIPVLGTAISVGLSGKRFLSLPRNIIDSIRKSNHYFFESEVFISGDIRKKLNEFATFKTYPVDKTLKYLNGIFRQLGVQAQYTIDGNFIKNITDYESESNSIIRIIIEQDKVNNSLRNLIEEVISLCGYFIVYDSGFIDDRTHRQMYLCQIEPIHQTSIIDIPRYLYHVTPANRAKKIKKQGLTSKKQVSICHIYPGRIYFFTEYNEDLFMDYLIRSWKMNVTGKDQEDNKFEILTIDRELLSKDIKWFTDLQYKEKPAVYTYTYIPPTAIIDSKIIELR